MVEETKMQPQEHGLDRDTEEQVQISQRKQDDTNRLLTARINGINEQKKKLAEYMDGLEKFEESEQPNFTQIKVFEKGFGFYSALSLQMMTQFDRET